jgi:hypothetical protein
LPGSDFVLPPDDLLEVVTVKASKYDWKEVDGKIIAYEKGSELKAKTEDGKAFIGDVSEFAQSVAGRYKKQSNGGGGNPPHEPPPGGNGKTNNLAAQMRAVLEK